MFDGYPLRVEYDLTPAGLSVMLLIDAVGDWWEAQEAARPAPQTKTAAEAAAVS